MLGQFDFRGLQVVERILFMSLFEAILIQLIISF